MKVSKKVKALMLAGVITVGIGAVGCDKKEEAPKEEVKQEQQVETKLTVEDLKKKSEVIFEDLENVAKNQFGKGSDKDGANNYIKYIKENNEWVFIQDPTLIGQNEPALYDLSDEEIKDQFQKIDFLKIYYEAFKKMNDEFIKGDLTKEDAYDKYMDNYNKWNQLINGSYIEAVSGLGAKTLGLVYEGLGNERDSITKIINMSRVVKDETERENNYKQFNDARLEKRQRYDDYLKEIYDNNIENIKKSRNK